MESQGERHRHSRERDAPQAASPARSADNRSHRDVGLGRVRARTASAGSLAASGRGANSRDLDRRRQPPPIDLGADRRASIADLDGSLLLAGADRPRSVFAPRRSCSTTVPPAWWDAQSGPTSTATRRTASCEAKARRRATGSSGRSSAVRDATPAPPAPTSSRGDSFSKPKTEPCRANPVGLKGRVQIGDAASPRRGRTHGHDQPRAPRQACRARSRWRSASGSRRCLPA